MIKEAFVDSYKLLCSNTKFETEEFLNIMKETMKDNNKQEELEKCNKEYSNIKSKKSKLLDLRVDDKISQDDYKVEKYNNRLEILVNKIEQLKLLQEDKQSISDGLIKIKELLKNNDIMENLIRYCEMA